MESSCWNFSPEEVILGVDLQGIMWTMEHLDFAVPKIIQTEEENERALAIVED